MDLTPDQKQAVAQWVAAGDSLSAIQQKLADQFKVSMTYMDVRFLVDDLDLRIKDANPVVDASDVTKVPERAPAGGKQEKKGFIDKMKEKVGLGSKEDAGAEEAAYDEEAEEAYEEELPPDAPLGGGNVTVSVDKLTLIPGALASGTVTFSDGVTGKWIVDQYGRPGFTEISKPGYRPSQADAQVFMRELSAALQRQGY